MEEHLGIQDLIADLRSSDVPRLVLLPDAPRPSPRSVALLSGSFDPITIGHAALAQAAAEHVDLVVLIYSARTLPKDGDGSEPPLLSEAERIGSVGRFCRSRSKMEMGLCSHGLLADQVSAARDRFPTARLSLVMGSDKLLQLFDHRWYDDLHSALGRLFTEAEVLYAARAGDEQAVADALAGPEAARWRDRIIPLDVPPDVAAISSRAVRRLHRDGVDVGGLVPPEVMEFL